MNSSARPAITPAGKGREASKRPRSLRILSLDGGGIKGYTSLLILKRIFRQLGQISPNKAEPKPCEVFDLIVGTSTGGLIATMLGRLELSIDESLACYETISRKIFEKRQIGGHIGRFVHGMAGSSWYDIKNLQTCVKDLLKKQGIPIDTPFRGGTADLSKVMLCVTRAQSKQADVLRNYVTHTASEENYDCQIWEAASATAAAPMYFESVKFEKGGEGWCDGGLQQNNPINVALREASRHDEFMERKLGCVLSIGTGVSAVSAVSTNLAVFLKQSIEMMTDSETIANNFAMSSDGQELSESKRYFRFNVPQGLQDLEMDEWREIEKMKAMTTSYLGKAATDEAVTACALCLLEPDKNLEDARQEIKTLLPASNCHHFIERPEYSQRLTDFFCSGKRPRRFVLWGMGGIGKTQIALNYALEKAKTMSVFWVHSDSRMNFSNDYRRILRTLCPESISSTDRTIDEEILAQTCQALQKHRHCLLILDNADDFDLFNQGQSGGPSLSAFLPENADIIVTTRDRRLLGFLLPASHGEEVSQLGEDQSDRLLLNSVPAHLAKTCDHKTVRELLAELAGLPLAIAQAAANIRVLQWSLAQFIEAYREKKDRMDLMSEPAVEDQSDNTRPASHSILVTWEMSFEYLEAKFPRSAVCLNIMSLFHWQYIPSEILRCLPQFKELSKVAFQNVIKHLLHLSLINETAPSDGLSQYIVHPIIHERVLFRLRDNNPGQIADLLDDAVAVMEVHFPCLSKVPEQARKSSDFPVTRSLIPHALHQAELMDSIKIESQAGPLLCHSLSLYFHAMHSSSRAVAYSSRAVKLSRELWRSPDAMLLTLLATHVECLHSNSQHDEAKVQAWRSLQMLDLPNVRLEFEEEKMGNAMERSLWNLLLNCYTGLKDFKTFLMLTHYQIHKLAKTAQDPRDLRWPRSGQPYALFNLGRIDEARELTDGLLLELSQDPEWKEDNKALYTQLQDLRADISTCNYTSIASTAERNVLKRNLISDRREVFECTITTRTVHDPATWIAGTAFIQGLLSESSTSLLREALEVATRLLREGRDLEIFMQGPLLHPFRGFISHATFLWIEMKTRLSSPNGHSGRALEYVQLFEAFLEWQEASIEEYIGDSAQSLHLLGNYLRRFGHFVDTEALYRKALASWLAGEDTSSLPWFEEEVHYQIMVTMVLQGNRYDDTAHYRLEHSAKFASLEAGEGNPIFRMWLFGFQFNLLNIVRTMLLMGGLPKECSWYQGYEHNVYRAQMIWGWLDASFDPWADSEEITPQRLMSEEEVKQEIADHLRIVQAGMQATAQEPGRSSAAPSAFYLKDLPWPPSRKPRITTNPGVARLLQGLNL